MVLDGDESFGVFRVTDVAGDDSVDFNDDVIAFAGDAIGIPAVALEGVSGTGAESGYAFFVAFDGIDEPLAAAFIIESAGPAAFWVAIDFCLIAECAFFTHLAAEKEAAVGFAFR